MADPRPGSVTFVGVVPCGFDWAHHHPESFADKLARAKAFLASRADLHPDWRVKRRPRPIPGALDEYEGVAVW